MRKKLFTSFTLVMCMALILVVQVQAQVTIDKNGDMYVEKGLKGSFPGAAIVIDGDGYLNIETRLKGKAAPVERTGQTESYATGDDGDLQRGAIWPNPRFTDNGNGTVTDNLTGLIWLKNANCFGGSGGRDWDTALGDCTGLKDGDCGLSDGSSVGDWHLPNRRELDSLVDITQFSPSLPNGHPFLGVQSYNYWSSTTTARYPSRAWSLNFYNGDVYYHDKSYVTYVWCVRGGN